MQQDLKTQKLSGHIFRNSREQRTVCPLIARLVEQKTVSLFKLKASLGRWFESASDDVSF